AHQRAIGRDLSSLGLMIGSQDETLRDARTCGDVGRHAVERRAHDLARHPAPALQGRRSRADGHALQLEEARSVLRHPLKVLEEYAIASREILEDDRFAGKQLVTLHHRTPDPSLARRLTNVNHTVDARHTGSAQTSSASPLFWKYR